jgi:hypothetical protein
MFGHEISSPVDLILGNPQGTPNPTCPLEYVELMKNILSETYDFVNDNLKRAALKEKKYYDRGLKPRQFSEGDYVWRWYPPTAVAKLALG